MATGSDVRAIMGLDRPTGPRPAKKKQKTDIRPRMSGITRELQGLMGDSVPPVQLTEAPKYKAKPDFLKTRRFKPRHWDQKEFSHGGRSDGLILQHWKRAIPGTSEATTTTAVEKDGNTDPQTKLEYKFEEEFLSGKWDVKVQVPSYTIEQYEQHLKSDEWSKTETDYLLELCRDFDLRWILVADRYDPTTLPEYVNGVSGRENGGTEGGTDTEGVQSPKYPERKMEALKARYYTVSAKMLALQTPPNNMTQDEYSLWEKMEKFDAKTEGQRKAYAEKLFERTAEEAEEERVLLEELARITRNEEDFLRQRLELYQRLEPAPSKRSNGEEQSTAMYQTSSGLSMLLQTLLAKEKRFKRPSVVANGEAVPGSAVSDRSIDKKGQPNQYSRRDTMDSQAESVGPQKKGSQTQPNVRKLTPDEEARYGVSHPTERIVSGVQFRHEKITKITMAKSATQTQKLQAALVELAIPPRLVMPTDRVCKEFERLVGHIQILLDQRKMTEKLANEIKILQEMKRVRLGLPKEDEDDDAGDKMDVDEGDSLMKQEVSDRIMKDGEDTAMENDDNPSSTRRLSEGDNRRHLDGEDNDREEDEEANNDTSLQVEDQEEEEEEEPDAEGEDEDEAEEEEEEEESVAENPEYDDEDDEEEQGGRVSFRGRRDEESEPEVEEDEHDGGDGQEEVEDAEVEESSEGEAENASASAEEDDEEEEEEPEQEPEEEEEEVDEPIQVNDDAQESEDSDAPSVGPRPTPSYSAATRRHKRSASVVSDASRAASNRSAVGRKKRG